jgi:hypothetical protein
MMACCTAGTGQNLPFIGKKKGSLSELAQAVI